MNGSTDAPPRTRRVHPIAWLMLPLALAVGVGCAEDAADAGVDDPFDSQVPPDVGPRDGDMDPNCERAIDRRCYDDPDVRCQAVAEWVADQRCVDADRDCFVGACPGMPEVEAALGDCDDRNPAVYPGAPETCTDVDHDCDGEPLGGFDDLGGECTACGAVGKWECSIDDPYIAACSVTAGQSDAPTPLPEETCDGLDQDCDGLVDEGCRLSTIDGVPLRQPALCPDGAVAVIEGEALVLFSPTDGGAPLRSEVDGAGLPALPHCGPAGLAWLERMDGMPCAAVDGAPLACPSTVWFQPAGGTPLQITDLPGAFGRPVVGQDGIWWHSVLADQPSLLTWPLDADRPQAAVQGAYSDPTAPDDDGWMAVRAWDEGEPRVTQVNIDNGSQRSANGAPGGQIMPGPPSRDGEWLAWSGGGEAPVVWVVTARGDDGFRPVAGPGPQRRPRLAGEVIVWLDEAAGGALRAFDLRTGDERLLAAGPVGRDDFAVRRGEVVWIEGDAEAGQRLRRVALPGGEPAPEPEPEPEADMGVDADLGVDEADLGLDVDLGLDGGVDEADMGPEEADMGPEEVDMGPEEADMGPEEADMGPEGVDLGPDMAP